MPEVLQAKHKRRALASLWKPRRVAICGGANEPRLEDRGCPVKPVAISAPVNQAAFSQVAEALRVSRTSSSPDPRPRRSAGAPRPAAREDRPGPAPLIVGEKERNSRYAQVLSGALAGPTAGRGR